MTNSRHYIIQQKIERAQNKSQKDVLEGRLWSVEKDGAVLSLGRGDVRLWQVGGALVGGCQAPALGPLLLSRRLTGRKEIMMSST